MKAAIYRRYGPPEVVTIEDVPKPIPNDNEVLVRVHAASVGAPDVHGRSGDHIMIRYMMGVFKPRKPGRGGVEFSGEIVEAGKNVKRYKVGDLIFGMAMNAGAHAEYICIPEASWTAIKPAALTMDEAAAIMFGAGSSLVFMQKAEVGPGKNVLIYGASGAVGVSAVQMAKLFGARVTGVCSTANLDFVKSLGADAVIDYTKEDFSSAGRIYDVVFDAVGKSGVARSLKALKRGGSYAMVAGPLLPSPARLWAMLTGAAKVLDPFTAIRAMGPQMFTPLWKFFYAGQLKPFISRRFRLDQIAEAHAYAGSGRKVGSALVVMDKSQDWA